MNLRLIRVARFPLVLLFSAAVSAAPQVMPLGEADKHGAIVYSVKCDDGSKKILQCVRDDQHCGYAGDTPLAALVGEACGARAPAPTGGESSFETAPAYP